MGISGKINTPCRMVCTGCFAVCWVLLVVVTLMLHISISVLVPEIKDLPTNLRTGFYDGFGFGSLATESEKIKAQSVKALLKCNETNAHVTLLNSRPLVYCNRSDLGYFNQANAQMVNGQLVIQPSSNTQVELNAMKVSFRTTLNEIKKIVNDKYLGQDEFQGTASDLDNLTAEVDNVQLKLNEYSAEPPCYITNEMYCAIYAAADSMYNGTRMVTDEIDKLVDGDEVKQFNEFANLLDTMHGLPYILWVSMLFFSCFWMVDKPACCCCSPNKGAGCAYCVHLVLWYFFFIITIIVCAVGYGIKEAAKTQKMDNFRGSPTLNEFMDHLETNYPGFYDVVLKDMLVGLEGLLNAFTGLAIIVLFIFFYGCGICCSCGKPYYSSAEESQKVVDISEVGGSGTK